MLQIFSNLVVIKTLSPNHRMYNLYTKFVKILEICKQLSENIVNESGNVPRNSTLSSITDSTLGLRCRSFVYWYSEVIRSLMIFIN